MFGFFKRKVSTPPARPIRSLPLPSELTDTQLIASIRDTFTSNHVSVASLFLVAYANFTPYYSVFCNSKPGEAREYTADLDGMAELLADAHARYLSGSEHDEVNKRRFFYLYLSALLWAAHRRAKANPELWDALADVWIPLLEGGRALRATLDRTSLWKSDETVFFDDVRTEDDGERHVEGVMMPSEVRYHTKVNAWRERDLPQDIRDDLAQMDKLLRGE